MKKKLDNRQKAFCKNKALGLSNEEAAIKAGYSKATAKTKSHLMVERSEIKKEIERLTNKVAKVAEEKFGYTAEQSFQKLLEIQKLALAPDGESGKITNLQAALKAEELKGRLTQLYIEKVENNIKSSGLTIEVKK